MGKKSFKEIRAAAKVLYFGIGVINCRALKDEPVVFRKHGWRHLSYKSFHIRPIPDQVRRFNLLRFAKIALENSQTVAYKLENKNGYNIHFWTIHYTLQDLVIRIVIRQINEGSKHFFSIMNK